MPKDAGNLKGDAFFVGIIDKTALYVPIELLADGNDIPGRETHLVADNFRNIIQIDQVAPVRAHKRLGWKKIFQLFECACAADGY